MRGRQGHGGSAKAALRGWQEGSVPGRYGRVRARPNRLNGSGLRKRGQAGHCHGVSKQPAGSGCGRDGRLGAAGRPRTLITK